MCTMKPNNKKQYTFAEALEIVGNIIDENIRTPFFPYPLKGR